MTRRPRKNICIYLRQNRPPGVAERLRRLQHGVAALSIITYGELRYGAERSQRRSAALEALTWLVSLLPVLVLPEEAGAAYGKIRGQLKAAGSMIGGNDLWIAAHAQSAGLMLVTNNEREFRRIPGLRFQNWA
jgi:tRNA(fMet)-specific endonuclease VapC